MARQRTSPLEDVISAISKLPWWIGAVLALVSFLVLHAIASNPVAVTVTGPEQVGDVFRKSVVHGAAMFGQIILPFVFGVGAIVSGINSIRQKKLYDGVASRPNIASINELSWHDFERLVGEYYRRNGFQVAREGGNGPDGGIDLILHRDGEMYLVQCKQWRAYKVGVEPVRAFYGVMAAHGAAGGYFVTSGVYTEAAQAFVQGLNLELVDGRKLREMIAVARQHR